MDRRADRQPARGGLDRDGTWPRRRLIAAGFEPPLARNLAADPRIDLHELLNLLDRGCPHTLAARILWPLDEEPPKR